MKGKKLVSILTASALAATMAMPTMAADGGTIDVGVTTKTGILRVDVPTTLAIAVDQFETTDAGSQIYSEDFTIANKSEVNVKVSVTSTATVGSNVTLASKRADVATATGTNGTAWLAVAASLDGSKYEANSKLGDLSEASANVTTFAKNGTATTAAQTFYLKKGQADTDTYKLLKPSADAKNNDVSYAQFYELTAIATQPTSNETLAAEVAANDVYVGSGTSGNETDGAVLTKIAKGSIVDASNNSWVSGKVYYTIANAATETKDLKAAKIYAYGELEKESTGADAAFRYIGALSSNKEVWSSTDVPTVNIAYTIQGLPQSTYDAAVTDGITYGLYKEKVAAVYTVSGGKWYLSSDGSVGFTAAPTSLSIGGTAKTSDDYTYHNNGWIELKADPGNNAVIEFIVNGTTYKVTTPAS